MAISNHILNLQKKHAQLAEQIDKYEHTPLPDPTQIHVLKKQKLKIKDEILRCSSGLCAPN